MKTILIHFKNKCVYILMLHDIRCPETTSPFGQKYISLKILSTRYSLTPVLSVSCFSKLAVLYMRCGSWAISARSILKSVSTIGIECGGFLILILICTTRIYQYLYKKLQYIEKDYASIRTYFPDFDAPTNRELQLWGRAWWGAEWTFDAGFFCADALLGQVQFSRFSLPMVANRDGKFTVILRFVHYLLTRSSSLDIMLVLMLKDYIYICDLFSLFVKCIFYHVKICATFSGICNMDYYMNLNE